MVRRARFNRREEGGGWNVNRKHAQKERVKRLPLGNGNVPRRLGSRNPICTDLLKSAVINIVA